MGGLQGVDTYSNILYVKEQVAALSHLAHRCVLTDKYTPQTCCIIGNYYSLKAQHEKARPPPRHPPLPFARLHLFVRTGPRTIYFTLHYLFARTLPLSAPAMPLFAMAMPLFAQAMALSAQAKLLSALAIPLFVQAMPHFCTSAPVAWSLRDSAFTTHPLPHDLYSPFRSQVTHVTSHPSLIRSRLRFAGKRDPLPPTSATLGLCTLNPC